jgi:RNA polymerase sigma-70 factor, ECF subfamily
MGRQDLVERARDGDRDAFGELAAREIDHLLVVARLILRDPDLAEDAVQEALVRCWKQLPRLRDVERFDAWLRRILMHAAFDQARRRKRHIASIQLIRSEPSVADGTKVFGDREQLDRGFTHLSVEHRAVVVLHHYIGLPLPEVATVLGIPVGTAKSRYHYAMSALRAAIEAEGRTSRQESLA